MLTLVRLIVLSLLLVVQSAVAETWENNLIIDLPKGHDVFTADWNDLECLAANIYHEARGESTLGQELVAQVTVNRIRSRYYLNTACDVVREDRQFSWTQDGKSDSITDRAAYEKAYKIAIRYLYLGRTVALPGARSILNYHAVDIDPNWYTLEATFDVGRHRFYRRTSA